MHYLICLCVDEIFKGGELMAGYEMMGSTGMAGMLFFSIVYFSLVAFVFSLIFWLTHNWLVKDKKKK